MLRIKKDNVELIVTEGAFENQYESMGFKIVSGKTVEKAAVSDTVASTSTTFNKSNSFKQTKEDNKKDVGDIDALQDK